MKRIGLMAALRRWRGKPPQTFEKAPLDSLEQGWTFKSGRAPASVQAIRLYSLLNGLQRRPRSVTIVPVFPAPRWTCYFVYAPEGRLSEAHLFTLARLRAMAQPLMVICAAPQPDQVPLALRDYADALYWKGLGGYDFSAYRLGLGMIATASPHADVLVLNDSIYGPFTDLEPLLANAPWDLTGFTAFSLIENHIQSYAFQMRDVTPRRVRALRTVMPGRWAFKDYRSVIYLQETRFARIAARHMTVGALWYADAAVCGDPSLYVAPELLAQGFPFLKKSLFGRSRGIQDATLLQKALAERGHPLSDMAETA
ncbi:lipopolysaccharide biosynthesis protein [Sphingomonas sp. SORGH_AS870]|uniref:rhamnan synthesis F family protein n=1 Tax=Sphingomonas sp. SORGH_AS_0870 TaxID=3041801 RepID=UPI00286002AD|nr:hypothetical protein [Sphingomonas sp. SORGH_AS_0870]MDR6144209.1 lipopolysaccharide biosynthesis protein [Sphingomonas sp. SORGH_AS_0870]